MLIERISQKNLFPMLSHAERRAIVRALKKAEKKERKRNGRKQKIQPVYAENRAKT